MKVIFAGTTDFGIPTLEMLKENFELKLVIAPPDKPVGKKKVLTAPAVKQWAITNGYEVIQPARIQDALTKIQEISPDVMVVAAYGQIIPLPILNLPKHGSINLHSSLLPKYRGASPIHAAILNDDKETGVTIMAMDEKLDHGPILGVAKVSINEHDNYPSLHKKLSEIAPGTLLEVLQKIQSGQIQSTPQDESQATNVKMFSREDARIDWTKPARSILQKIKAYNTEPGTWTTLDGKSVKIIAAEEAKDGRIELPGKIYQLGSDCLVKCGDYSLKLLTVQPEGKKPYSGKDFLNGLKNLETKVFV